MDEKQVPPSVKEWEGQIAAEEVGDNTIRSIELNSTSNIRYSRYLHLRVLRKQKKPMDFNPKDFDLDRWKHQADEKLASYELWRTYLDNFNYPDDIKEGGFMIATHHQRQSAKVQTNAVTPNTFLSPVAGRTRSKIHHNPTETPSKSTGEPADLASTMDRLGFGGESRPETPVETPENLNTPISWTPESSIVPKELQRILYQETEDEQIVNAALLEFTNALTILFRLSNMWSFHRKPLVAKFKKASLEARLDGYLRDEQSRKIRAIIEVKAAWRYQRLRQIFMQESAQMVAWIMNDPSIDLATNRRGRCIQVSQDRHQIFLIFGECGDAYLKYLKGEQIPTNNSSPDSFLIRHELGPWSVGNKNHMRHLGPILLAIALRADADVKEEEAAST